MYNPQRDSGKNNVKKDPKNFSLKIFWYYNSSSKTSTLITFSNPLGEVSSIAPE